MTFPRVFHSDLFSDSGPVDGTVLVNSHSDAIEALQAEATLSGHGAPVAAGTAVGQTYYDLDAPMQPYAWDGANWYQDAAVDTVARGDIASLSPSVSFLVSITPTYGTGAPTGTPAGMQFYADISPSPAKLYLYNPDSATWIAF